jgi:hypothetical protein
MGNASPAAAVVIKQGPCLVTLHLPEARRLQQRVSANCWKVCLPWSQPHKMMRPLLLLLPWRQLHKMLQQQRHCQQHQQRPLHASASGALLMVPLLMPLVLLLW